MKHIPDSGTLLAIRPGARIDTDAITAGIMPAREVIQPGGFSGGEILVLTLDFPFWSTHYYGYISREISRAVAIPEVKALVLDFDSPGGVMYGCGELADFIADQDTIKPIYAHVTGAACSAAYLLAAACRDITISETAEIGCIGTVAMWWDDTEWEKKSGIRFRALSSRQTPLKVLDPNTEEGEARLQAKLDASADLFIAQVARHRGVSTGTVLQEYGAGDTFQGQAAVDKGMAERVGTLVQMVEQLKTRGRLMPKSKGLTVGAVYVATADDDLQEFAITAESLAAREDGAAVIAQIKTAATELAQGASGAARDQAVQAAVTAERSRVSALLALEIPGAEAAVRTAIQSGATAEATAVAIVAAQKDAGVTLQQTRLDAPGVVQHAGVTQVAKDTGWDASARRVAGAKK